MTLHVAEFQGIGVFPDVMQFPKGPPLRDYVLAVGATQADGATVDARATLLRLKAFSACQVTIAVTPLLGTEADTPGIAMGAGETEYIVIPPNSSCKVAVIDYPVPAPEE